MAKNHFFALFIMMCFLVTGCATRVAEKSTSEPVDAETTMGDSTSRLPKESTESESKGKRPPKKNHKRGFEHKETLIPSETDSASSTEDGIVEAEPSLEYGKDGPPEVSKSFKKRKAVKPAKKMSSGLSAGVSDDNKQFNYFLNFLKKYESTQHLPLNITERIILQVKDLDGKSIPNARVKIYDRKNLLEKGSTYADGTYMFYPSERGPSVNKFKARITFRQITEDIEFQRDSHRNIEVILNTRRGIYTNIPVDILFILDTTGSMGEEIYRLKKTIEIINLNISSLSSKPRVRFGMVLYRDKRDKYLTKTIQLTDSLDEFTRELNLVKAGGGGDTPEDLQAALYDSMKKIKWNRDGIRIGFIITDAPPHLDYGQNYTYVNASKDAKNRSIKIFTIGTGGLNLSGEYVLRQIAQYTYGKYIFLTYGERGESEGGIPGSVSHHTGANYQIDKLEAIIIRIAKEEISYLTDHPLQDGEDFFQARKIDMETSRDTLKKLFDRAVTQLVDYSTIAIPKGTPAAITPIGVKKESLRIDSELFTEQLLLSFSRNGSFKTIEREDLQKILKETNLQMTGLIDERTAAKTGKLLGAKMIITGRMVKKSNMYIVFLKLIQVETAEILSITKLKINKNLGTSDELSRCRLLKMVSLK